MCITVTKKRPKEEVSFSFLNLKKSRKINMELHRNYTDMGFTHIYQSLDKFRVWGNF